ncbi:hypothetical protein OpiT1DRAFT_05280 [Opitutaceae bacterium TAV1]|nr:hypothetical protein OpiT1DRAFT_05280 [Opitutaceae bacterium TAV1]
MNNLEALIIIRGAARVSAQMRTRQGRSAFKVVEKKIQSLLRKKAWREGGGIPVHMGSPDFTYPIPDDPVTAALRELLAAEAEFVGSIQDLRSPRLRAAVEAANVALAGIESPEERHGE